MFLAPFFIIGQSEGIYVDEFSTYTYNLGLINAAYIPSTKESQIHFHSKNRNEPLSDVYRIGLSAQKVFTKGKTRTTAIRVIASSEKEGPYISTSRAYLNYTLGLQLNKDLFLLAGTSLGFVNPSYNTPKKAQSALVLDGDIGLIFRYKTSLEGGLSMSHLFNSIAADVPGVMLNRYYKTYLNYSLTLNPTIEWESTLLWFYFTDIPGHYYLSSKIIFDKSIDAGLGINLKRGIFAHASIKALKTKKHPLRIAFLYNSPLFDNSTILGASLEINLMLSF